jgi:hypothetical protein
MHGRNERHARIVNKLAQMHVEVEVRIILQTPNLDQAFNFEKWRISFWRLAGVQLANFVDGGGGVSGWKHSTQEVERIRKRFTGNKFHLGRKFTEEWKRNISLSVRASKTPEVRKKHSDASKGENNYWFGKTQPAQTRAAVANANRRRVWSTESKNKMAATMTGRRHTDSTKEKNRQIALQRWARVKAEKDASRLN